MYDGKSMLAYKALLIDLIKNKNAKDKKIYWKIKPTYYRLFVMV